MSEAKPQDGSTVKGYRTLTPGDIEVMNRLKDVSRHFLNLLDTSKETGADPAGLRWQKRRCKKPVCLPVVQLLSRMTTAEFITRRICECA